MADEQTDAKPRLDEQIVKHIDDSKDSIEIGTPGKGGCIKAYGDFSKKQEFEEKLLNAAELRQFARKVMEE